jgi:hypothetical protein
VDQMLADVNIDDSNMADDNIATIRADDNIATITADDNTATITAIVNMATDVEARRLKTGDAAETKRAYQIQ